METHCKRPRAIMSFIAASVMIVTGCAGPTISQQLVVNLPHGGQLQLLSAYYMPDPKPPANSNQVEGDAKPPENGKIFKPLKKLYEDHADFGGGHWPRAECHH